MTQQQTTQWIADQAAAYRAEQAAIRAGSALDAVRCALAVEERYIALLRAADDPGEAAAMDRAALAAAGARQDR